MGKLKTSTKIVSVISSVITSFIIIQHNVLIKLHRKQNFQKPNFKKHHKLHQEHNHNYSNSISKTTFNTRNIGLKNSDPSDQPNYPNYPIYNDISKFYLPGILPIKSQVKKHECHSDLYQHLTAGYWEYNDYHDFKEIAQSKRNLEREYLQNLGFRGFPNPPWDQTDERKCGERTTIVGKELSTPMICNPGSDFPVCKNWEDTAGPSKCDKGKIFKEVTSETGKSLRDFDGEDRKSEAMPVPIDFRTELQYPELGHWKLYPNHHNTCENKLQLYNRHTACSFLKTQFQQKYDVVHFIGDSLTRNHFFGLMTILMVQESKETFFNSRYFPEVCSSPECCLGFQKIWLPAQNCSAKFYEREICGVTFKYSWFDSSTFLNVLTEIKQVGDNLDNNSNFRNRNQQNKTQSNIFKNPRSLFFINMGAHFAYKFDPVKRKFLDKLFDQPLAVKSNMVWMHQLLPNKFTKPYPYRVKSQNHEYAKEYYAKVQEYCEENGIKVLDFTNLGNKAVSWDGTHYTFAVSIIRGQVVLNLLNSANF